MSEHLPLIKAIFEILKTVLKDTLNKSTLNQCFLNRRFCMRHNIILTTYAKKTHPCRRMRLDLLVCII